MIICEVSLKNDETSKEVLIRLTHSTSAVQKEIYETSAQREFDEMAWDGMGWDGTVNESFL